MRNALAICVALGWLFYVAAMASADPPALEKWADAKLPQPKGLFLWLDAKTQNAARYEARTPRLVDGGKCGVLFDGSGNHRHLTARAETAQPKFLQAGLQYLVRFDGVDDCLEIGNLREALGPTTLFLLAAPRTNAGGFRALCAANLMGQWDYLTGLTVDMGGSDTKRFESLNVEGAGFSGAVNLLKSGFDLGQFHVIEIVAAPGKKGVQLWIDGQPQGHREQGKKNIGIDEFTLGARFFSDGSQPPSLRGFFDGDVAQVLLYDRALSDDERSDVRKYLLDEASALDHALAGAARTTPLVAVTNPPAAQLFVPGFEVRELPVELRNINCVKYRADGKLMALGYDGHIYLLTDSNGDGLEETVSEFWDGHGLMAPIGMALTPPGYAAGQGVFVPNKTKVSLIVDNDGDDKADQEIVAATGWKPLHHTVDALGVAVAPDGSLYFGLGTPAYSNGYQLDKEGKSHFDLHGQNGTVQKVSPDLKHRETYCSGVRFTVAMAFNDRGDLFATDQEGATWMPNGNPFDELLHIQPGRYYGFPPRHPKHLPDVIDEPSTFDFRPQHQCTCGLNFNLPVNGGPTFGAAFWAGDALVTGFSRGKLYRVKLATSPAGYIAQSSIFACLNMMVVDACVSPRGDLVVAVHSGGPDWGSGPSGMGKLYKISYVDRAAPQPVMAWASSPNETRIAFDRPLDPSQLKDLARQVTITAGEYVNAGDPIESIRPGYEAVQRQMAAPRYAVPVYGASVTADRRTLVLATGEQAEDTRRAIELPGLGRPTADAASRGVLPPLPRVDLGYDLCGVAATWQDAAGESRFTGWLPHVDLDVAKQLTVGVADCESLWPLVAQPGKLTLRTRLALANLLHPAMQPGSTLDYTPSAEEVTLTIESNTPFELTLATGKVAATAGENGRYRSVAALGAVEGYAPLEITLPTGAAPPTLSISFHTAEDDRERPLQLHRFLMLWVREKGAEPSAERIIPPELAGGNWLRGRQTFFSEQAMCFKCHTIGGAGGRIGPDLSNLKHRDYASVLRDIAQPNFAINPDYINYTAVLTDGRIFVGALRTQGDKIVVGDKDGRETTLDRADVDQLSPQATSIMPDGLPKLLGPERMKDLLTFLLFEPPEELLPAKIEVAGLPPSRSRADFEAVFQNAGRAASDPHQPAPEPKPLNIVLVAGPKDHGLNAHDYPVWSKRWQTLMALAPGVTVDVADVWPSAKQLKKADLLVWYSANPAWSAKKGPELDAFLERGGGMVYLHYAVNGQHAPAELAQRIGLAWKGGRSKFREGPIDLQLASAKGQPILAGLPSTIHFEDEAYWQMVGDPAKLNVLASSTEENEPQPILWTVEHGKGRVFCSILGHYTWTFDDPMFRLLILRGMAWTAHEPVERFEELSRVGARFE